PPPPTTGEEEEDEVAAVFLSQLIGVTSGELPAAGGSHILLQSLSGGESLPAGDFVLSASDPAVLTDTAADVAATAAADVGSTDDGWHSVSHESCLFMFPNSLRSSGTLCFSFNGAV
ncbi:hypothetical protein Ahia01_000966500, partial [Argonauta hians]